MKLNKLEQRAKETRELLLRAAEKVFVREGYEKADLAEIAKIAGRTKGAIYGQFASKEEVFLALIEQHARRHREAMRNLLQGSRSTTENLSILKTFLVGLSGNESWGLLLLEFKLYAIRHPESRQRFYDLYTSILPADEETEYRSRLGSPATRKGSVSRTKAVHASFAILYALQIEQAFDPTLFSSKDISAVSALIFDALFSGS